jgi:fructose-1,6-bisphosphatase/inositol monophosphatase family enzyme
MQVTSLLPMAATPAAQSGAHLALPSGIGLEALLVELRRLSWGAADILRAYGRGEQPPYGFPPALSVDNGGEGPVSAADLAVNQWLLDGLGQAFPAADWTLLSEETAKEQLTAGEPLAAEWLWILDPLDGTKDFLQGTGEYAVHIALAHRGVPVLGVVLLPEMEQLWWGITVELAGEPGQAWCEDRAGRRTPVRFSGRRQLAELVLVASRNHRDQRLEQLLASAGSWATPRRSAAWAARWPRSCAAKPTSTSRSLARAPPRTGTWPPPTQCCAPLVVPSATPMAGCSPTTPATCARRAA